MSNDTTSGAFDSSLAYSRRCFLKQSLAISAVTVASGLSVFTSIARAEPLGLRYPDPLVVALDESFLKYRLFNASVERLVTGMRWAEGPVWFGDGRYVLLSDIPNNRIMRWDEINIRSAAEQRVIDGLSPFRRYGQLQAARSKNFPRGLQKAPARPEQYVSPPSRSYDDTSLSRMSGMDLSDREADGAGPKRTCIRRIKPDLPGAKHHA